MALHTATTISLALVTVLVLGLVSGWRLSAGMFSHEPTECAPVKSGSQRKAVAGWLSTYKGRESVARVADALPGLLESRRRA